MPNPRQRRIATEEAFAIPEQLDALRELIAASREYDPDTFLAGMQTAGGAITRRLLDLGDERLRIMDESGIAMHLLAMTSTGVQQFSADKGAAIATLGNDRLAQAIKDHPGRYAGLATVTPQNPARAVKEMDRAINTLELNGVMINSHTNGEYLDEPKYWPILEAADALDVPIYIHPRSPVPAMAAAYRKYQLEHAIWGYAVEVGLHAVRLILSGVFDRFPKLRIVIGHMGENIPYALYRLDYMATNYPFDRPKLRGKPSDYFRQNFAITTSGVNWMPALELCLKVLGPDNVMWAVDYPYQETVEATKWLDDADLPADVKDKLFYRNAERIFRIQT
jgi:predicted TIM-barrel fold metal-dependent hydrolase